MIANKSSFWDSLQRPNIQNVVKAKQFCTISGVFSGWTLLRLVREAQITIHAVIMVVGSLKLICMPDVKTVCNCIELLCYLLLDNPRYIIVFERSLMVLYTGTTIHFSQSVALFTTWVWPDKSSNNMVPFNRVWISVLCSLLTYPCLMNWFTETAETSVQTSSFPFSYCFWQVTFKALYHRS